MNLTAIFESWHVGDGNYPPLRKGQLVNLSFELEPRGVGEASDADAEELDTMRGQPFGEEFYVVDFDGAGLERASLPRTFLG
ncbi:MAG TPA: hypothetical protein VN228_03560 [Pyrinomonadaceae bacterium]|nr:hypothetical protein [Pyrinomonadaceae bacterium]